MPDEPQRVCPRCNGCRCVSVLGGGGDYEMWPCPECCREEYRRTLIDQYSPGDYGGE